MRRMRFLILSALAVGMLFASCKPDEGRGMRGKAGFILENGARWCMIDSIGETYYRMHENLVMGGHLDRGNPLESRAEIFHNRKGFCIRLLDATGRGASLPL